MDQFTRDKLELGLRAAVALWLENQPRPASLELPTGYGWGETRLVTVEVEGHGYRVEERRYPGTGRVVLEVS